ncbi:MAG TPA: response regulator [Candidatus Obscuribacterales bacterium]
MGQKSIKLLLIEDSRAQIRLLEQMLAEVKGARFEIECAEKLSDGLSYLSKNSFDVVLLDLSLPDASGLDTLVSVHCQHPHVPIVVLTGLDDESVAMEAVKLGAQDYLLKGQVQGPMLARAIRYAIERKGAEERIKQLNEDRERRIIELSSANKALDALTRELAQARDVALEAASFKTDFVASVSHELRTPISSILGMIELLLKTPLGAEQREFATAVYRASQSLLDSLDSIVDLSKMEAGKLELEEVDFSPVSVVEDTAESFAQAADQKGIRLATFIDPRISPLVKGDPVRLRQVLCHLIENAVQFTARGAVMVQALPDTEEDTHVTLRFAVSDTGVGMSESIRKRLFEPVIRTDGSTVRKIVGPGLGLSVCQRLVKLMGGRIGVESEEGEGSTFWFTVRFRRSETVRPGASPFLAACASNLRDVRVMLVDNNPATRRAIETYLQAAKVMCEAIGSADEAIDALNRAQAAGSPFDVAIVDLAGAPGATLEAALRIKLDPVLKRTRLLLVGIKPEEIEARDLLSADFAEFMSRPVRQARLIDAIATAMERTVGELKLEPVPAEPEAETPSVPPSARILLAEDDAALRRLIVLQLQRLGFKVEVAASGQEAIDMAQVKDFDAILMDCQMPGVDGFAATRAIREAEKKTGLHTPIIAMTASAMPGDRESCLAAGMDDYLSKPLGLQQLKEKLEQWTGQSATTVEVGQTAGTGTPMDVERMTELYGKEALREIVPLFTQEASELLDRLSTAMDKKDKAELAAITHQLKGLCASVAADEMALCSAQLEEFCKEGNWQASQEALQTLLSLYKKVSEFVKTLKLSQ